MEISASDVVPFTQARATLSDLAERVKAGAEKIIAKNGESDVALIDAERLDYYHRLGRERIHLLLMDDARRGLAVIAAGRTQDADAGRTDGQLPGPAGGDRVLLDRGGSGVRLRQAAGRTPHHRELSFQFSRLWAGPAGSPER